MGTGFVSEQRALVLRELVESAGEAEWPPPDADLFKGCHYRPTSASELPDAFAVLRAGYQRAVDRGRGLVMVDFRE
jgi:hypothetical protein